MLKAEPFGGAKLAALHHGHVLVYRRDDIPTIPFPGCIDLPGGGREGTESPVQCALRELHEEFGLDLPPARIIYARSYPNSHDTPLPSHFLALHLEAADIPAIRFGSEGCDPTLMPVTQFLAHPQAIPHLQQRLAACLATLNYTVS
ncbi:NUDIX domain-containing protein [Polymorphobacter multimanifer]|uniref:8-oxo-dGTP diphosphatase n=1 Tax=Polymorphobacter multimanifer TaxID=1070431 RepID=A0A841L540_9SPHN|nr:NUDIX hydrolase [Polymorphobacter multimanifer]MBB6227747.1 8-oxo-dGTP diphosphatase [Polymorphobacter multimanifer]GGI76686.1 NUDIX domain-containing protein [Polymorphobacter multimanifer]